MARHFSTFFYRNCVSVRSSLIPVDNEVRVYKKRWLMLGLYSFIAIANGMHWLQFSIISQTVENYYDVLSITVSWSAMTYSVVFIALVLPSLWVIEVIGLKSMLIIGDAVMVAGSWMKVAAVDRSLFYVAFTGQVVVAVAQVAIVNVPSYLAGNWFPADELSTACSIGVLATQVGVAIGFYLPPQIVPATSDKEELQRSFFCLYAIFAALPTILLPFLIFCFQSRPPKPPSFARCALNEEHVRSVSYWVTLSKSLLYNRNYLLLLLSYSCSLATYYSLSTLMGTLIVTYNENGEQLAGTLGAVMVGTSAVGCVLLGWVLDKTHKFKLTALLMYVVSGVGLFVFGAALIEDIVILLYFSSGLLGLFMVSYVMVAIEFSSELTYPINETISTSVLLTSGELCSIFLILISAKLLEIHQELALLIAASIIMGIGLLATCLISGKKLKRYEASLSPVSITTEKRSPALDDHEEKRSNLIEGGNKILLKKSSRDQIQLNIQERNSTLPTASSPKIQATVREQLTGGSSAQGVRVVPNSKSKLPQTDS